MFNKVSNFTWFLRFVLLVGFFVLYVSATKAQDQPLDAEGYLSNFIWTVESLGSHVQVIGDDGDEVLALTFGDQFLILDQTDRGTAYKIPAENWHTALQSLITTDQPDEPVVGELYEIIWIFKTLTNEVEYAGTSGDRMIIILIGENYLKLEYTYGTKEAAKYRVDRTELVKLISNLIEENDAEPEVTATPAEATPEATAESAGVLLDNLEAAIEELNNNSISAILVFGPEGFANQTDDSRPIFLKIKDEFVPRENQKLIFFSLTVTDEQDEQITPNPLNGNVATVGENAYMSAGILSIYWRDENRPTRAILRIINGIEEYGYSPVIFIIEDETDWQLAQEMMNQ